MTSSLSHSTGHVMLKLTPRQARVLWAVIDGAADAGACSDGSGNTPAETRALAQISHKLLEQRVKWSSAK